VSNEHSKILNLIGLNLRKIRLSKGLSQSQLAFEANLTREYINKVEAGKINITILNLEQIANVLEVNIHSFLEN
jgi:transcriptional regulator with XRE-family HTH domain